jgi:isochorismate synthase
MISSVSALRFEKYREREIIAAWFQLAHEQGMAAALWRLPSQPHWQLLLDTSGGKMVGRVDIEETIGGFVVAPFNNPDRSNETFLRADLYFDSFDRRLKSGSNLNDELMEHCLVRLDAILKHGFEQPSFYYKQTSSNSTDKEDYCRMVERAIDGIRENMFQKVVPAVSRRVPLKTGFGCLETFEQLSDNYPFAFVSLVTVPQLGTWMGASPESIIEIDENQQFTTVAVAGTQTKTPGLTPPEVAWKQKEIEEQALVSRYIINCFKKIRLREFVENGPKTVVAGNLLHLKTTFTVDMKETNFPLLGSVMLDLLHPTSAVCGMPKTPAQQFIEDHEKFNRSLFSGYLGPVNINNETHLFVNLRCMQIQANKAILYAGAGVTEDSIPEKEWIETQVKCDTLLDVLNL